jgi:hypothetical protein
MIFEEVQKRWIDKALESVYSGELSDEQIVKTLRTIGQIFEQRAQHIEMVLINRSETERAYDND